MNANLVISTVTGIQDNAPVRVETTWDSIIKACSKPVPRGKLCLEDYLNAEKSIRDSQKDGKGLIPGEFTRTGTRIKADLKNRRFLVLDLDDGFYTFEQLVKAMQGFECIVHTSYSHSEGKGKYRVFILFDEPVTEDIENTCSRMLDYFVSILGKHIDDKCWTVSQLYFTPSCPPDAVDLYRSQHIPGEPLRVADFQAPAPDKEQIKAARQSTGTRPGDDFNRRGSWRELLEGEGWRHYFDGKGCSYWTRPGKDRGISGAVFLDSNVFHCLSSAHEVFPFEAGKTYSLFSAYAVLNHGGDHTAAAKQLATEGYGGQTNQATGTTNATNTRPERIGEPTPGTVTDTPATKPFDLSRLTRGADISAGDYSVTFVVDKLIPENALILFYAKGGSGKSTLATQIGAAVTAGLSFMGLATLKRPVVIIDYENPLAVLRKRTNAVEESGNIYFWTSNNTPPQLNKKGWLELKDLIATLENPLIIIDTLSSACSGLDILSNGDYSPVMQHLIELRNMGATIILLHHTPKSDETKYIGASCIYNQVDHVLAMYPVQTPGVEKEVVNEDEAKVYRFGTKDKTRFEHYALYVEFDEDKGHFIPAANPDQDILDRLLKLITEQQDINQTGIINQIGASVPKGKLTRLLNHNEGRLWTVVPGAHNAKIYRPISSYSVFRPIGANNWKTENQLFSAPEKQAGNDTPQTPINSELVSYSTPFEKHEKQDDFESLPVFDF